MANIYLTTGDTNFLVSNPNTSVFGSAALAENILLASTATNTTVASTVEQIDLAGARADYTFKQGFGSNITVYNSLNVAVMTIADVNAKTLSFTDGTAALGYAGTTVTLGGTTVPSAAAAAVVPTTFDTTNKSSVTTTTTTTLPTFTVAPVAATVAEGSNATFTVTLTNPPTTGTTTVVYTLTGTGATLGTDTGTHTPAGNTGTLSFPAGTLTQTVTLPIVKDTVPETGEKVNITLSGASSGSQVSTTAGTSSITLTDDLTDATAPTCSTATINGAGTSIVLGFSEALDTTGVPASSAFTGTYTSGGVTTGLNISSVGMSGSTVILTLGAAVPSGATVNLAYNPPTTSPLQDGVGNDALTFSKTVNADTTLPTLTSSTPADNATSVAVGDNVVLTFSETVKAGTGNITIVNSANSADTRTIAVTDATQVTFSGTTVTINPAADLTTASNYYVNIPATAILDSIGNAFAGITNTSTLNFGTPGSSGTTGTTYTLTQGADTVPGTAGDDIINAFTDGGTQTFQFALDSITGGAGTGDTLTAYGLNDGVGAGSGNSLARVSGVEKFIFRAAGSSTYDMSTTSGYTSIANQGSTAAANLIFNNIALASNLVVEANGNTVAGAATQFNWLASSVAGTADAGTLNVSGNAGGVTIGAGLEILNIMSTGTASSFANTFNITANGTLNVQGSANLTLGTLDNNIRTLAADGFTGNLTINLDSTAGTNRVLSVATGSGTDQVTVLATDLSATTGIADLINLGGGTADTLRILGAPTNTVINSQVSNTEILRFGDAAATGTALVANNYSGIHQFTYEPAFFTLANGATTMTVTGLETADRLTFLGDLAGHGATAAGEIALSLAGAAAGQTANVTLGVAGTAGITIAGGASVGATAAGVGISVVSGITTLTIESLGTTVNTVTGGIGGVGGTDGLAITGVTNITVTGSQALTLGNVGVVVTAAALGVNNGTRAFGSGTNVSATAFTGNLTVYGSDDAATGDVMTGGSGNDNFFGGTGTDNLSGGTGNDTMDGGAGADVLSGGDGNDTLINITTGVNASAADNLTGGLGNDTFLLRGDVASGLPATIYATASRITDFSISGTNGTDVLQLSATVGNYSGGSALFAGIAAATAGGTGIMSLGSSSVGTAIVTGTDLLQLTSTVAAGASLQAMFNSAIGTTTLTGLVANNDLFFTLYDTTNSRMVVGVVDAGADAAIATGDTVTLIGTMDMTAANYALFTNANLGIIAA